MKASLHKGSERSHKGYSPSKAHGGTVPRHKHPIAITNPCENGGNSREEQRARKRREEKAAWRREAATLFYMRGPRARKYLETSRRPCLITGHIEETVP